MITETRVKQLINDLLEEQALVIGGIIAVHGMDDDLVWRLMKNLEVIRGRFLRRIEDRDTHDDNDSPPPRPNLKPHPAIEDFLLNIRRTQQ